MSVPLTLESRLILTCTRTEPDPHQIQHLIDRGPDWQAIVRAIEEWGVVSLVYTTLQAVAALGNVPTAVMEQLRHTYRRDTIHSIAQRDLIGVILQRFVDAAIPMIVLPNVALATRVYPAPNLRPIGDIDLLIHAHDHARAEALLAAIQIERPSFPYLGPWGIHQIKLHEHLATARGSASGATAVYPPTTEVWPRAQPAVIESVPTLVLSQADLLLQLALQLAESPHTNGQVRTVCDIAETCRCYADAIDWEHLATLAERYQATQQLRAALSVALELVGAAVPSSIVTGWHLAHTGQPALLRISTQLVAQPAPVSPPAGTPPAARAAPPEPPPTAAPQARVERAKATDAQGQLAVTYDQHGASDGVGAQLQRIYGLYALARTLNIKYVHTPLAQVRYQGFLSLLYQTPDPDFVERYNAFFTLPSDDFDLAGCERVKIHNLDLETVERYRAQAAATGRSILLETLLPFAYTDRYPAAYRTLHAVSPYREHRPAGPVRVCIHLRRGDNLPDSRRRWLPNAYYLRVCEQILGTLQRHGVPFTVRLHSELPDRRYALYPKFPGLYFELEQPVIIDPEEYALEEFDVLPNLEMVLNAEPLDAIHDFATADVLILSASSFGYFGGMLNPHGVTVFAPFTWNKPLPDWLIADTQGNLNEDEVAAKIADLLQRRG